MYGVQLLHLHPPAGGPQNRLDLQHCRRLASLEGHGTPSRVDYGGGSKLLSTTPPPSGHIVRKCAGGFRIARFLFPCLTSSCAGGRAVDVRGDPVPGTRSSGASGRSRGGKTETNGTAYGARKRPRRVNPRDNVGNGRMTPPASSISSQVRPGSGAQRLASCGPVTIRATTPSASCGPVTIRATTPRKSLPKNSGLAESADTRPPHRSITPSRF